MANHHSWTQSGVSAASLLAGGPGKRASHSNEDGAGRIGPGFVVLCLLLFLDCRLPWPGDRVSAGCPAQESLFFYRLHRAARRLAGTLYIVSYQESLLARLAGANGFGGADSQVLRAADSQGGHGSAGSAVCMDLEMAP